MELDLSAKISILKGIDSKDKLKSLFIEHLNFIQEDSDVKVILTGKIRESVEELTIIAGYENFKVLLCVLNKLLKGEEREIFRQVSNRYYENLIVFTDSDNSEWHFVNRKPFDEEKARNSSLRIRSFRRIVVGANERLRTAAERLFMIVAEEGDSSFKIQEKCDLAFDVEEVSRNFYSDFVTVYKVFKNDIKSINNINDNLADQITQKIFNRLIFLYYLQKKGYLENNRFYFKQKYEMFKDSNSRNYYKDFLIPLFKKLSLKDFFHRDFEKIPFLNGGLFDFEEEEERIQIPNSFFDNLFDADYGLLEKYNFTIREDTDFEQEVAIDPEMLGTIFEQLILKLEGAKFKDIPDARRSSGSYYTPKFIISFMVKQSILNYLIKECPSISEQKIKRLVFALDADNLEKQQKKKIRKALKNITVIDPAVGSGAFVVGCLLKMLEIIETLDSDLESETINEACYRYNTKLDIIQHNLYGVDIQERAVGLANLRLWLSLIVDLDVENPLNIPALPNLDFHILCGNSLVSHLGQVTLDIQKRMERDQKTLELLENYKELKEKYTVSEEKSKREKWGREIKKTKIQILKAIKKIEVKIEMQDVIKGKSVKDDKKLKKMNRQLEKLKETDVDKIGFNWGIDFFDIISNGGFDVVIGNPPYGIKEKPEVRDEFRLGNKDSYGIFTALGIEILKPGGTLCFIMSDTWQTIRTHKKLRDMLLEKTYIQSMISVPSDTFKATVNVGVYTFVKKGETENGKKINWIFSADFSPLKIREGELESAFDLFADLIPPDESDDPESFNHPCIIDGDLYGYTEVSERDWAIFCYRQDLIKLFSNHSFFIASPKLFLLMQDVGNCNMTEFSGDSHYKGDKIQRDTPVYRIDFNGNKLELVKLGDVADVKQGLATGDNYYYLRQSKVRIPGASRNYRVVDFNLVLKEEELERISSDEELRIKIIEKGISREPGNERYFGGRYFVPYDKGGASDIKEGWLPNYYVPTDYYIDWSEEAVLRMKTLTTKERNKIYGKRGGNDKLCSRFQNSESYFMRGISFSVTGKYSPLYKEHGLIPFDHKASCIFLKSNKRNNYYIYLALLNSLLIRYLLKTFAVHTVESSEGAQKKLPISCINSEKQIEKNVISISKKQKQDLRYDYLTNEQLEIDRLVYEIYNLNDEDIREVETWFFRRYPTLAGNIERKIKEKREGE